MAARRYYQVGGSGIEPGPVKAVAKREPGFDLYGLNGEPRWRQPRDRNFFANGGTYRDRQLGGWEPWTAGTCDTRHTDGQSSQITITKRSWRKNSKWPVLVGRQQS